MPHRAGALSRPHGSGCSLWRDGRPRPSTPGPAATRVCVERTLLSAAFDFDFAALGWSEQKRVEKLRHIHPQPGKARIGGASVVERLQDWLWSSFHHYLTGEEGVVEIESHWTATRRENQGIYPTVRRRDPASEP